MDNNILSFVHNDDKSLQNGIIKGFIELVIKNINIFNTKNKKILWKKIPFIYLKKKYIIGIYS